MEYKPANEAILSRRSARSNGRPTIGLLTSRISDELGTSFLTGVADAAEERDANVITFVGGSLRSPLGFEAQGNVLYDLVAAGVVDGLVVDSGLLGHYVGPEAMQDFCGRFRDIPVVSVEVPIEGIPSVLVDFYQGMRNVMTHLIEAHGYRRIAFIRGPEESLTGEERYRAYKDALAEHDIPLDMELVAPGTFFEPSGEEAVRLLLDKRKVEFEAVAAANDFMAVDAMQALQARGVRVPGDMAVTGFDDFGVASVVTPPLTTARLGNYERAQQAAEMLLAQLEEKEVSERVLRPAGLVVRRSCGCSSRALVEAGAGPVMVTGESLKVALAVQRGQILSEMVQGVGSSGVRVGQWAEQLRDALSAEFGGKSTGAFLSALDEVLNQVAAAGGNVTSWQGALSVLRCHAVPSLGSPEALARAENLWQQARVMIGEAAERTQAYRSLQSERRAQVLREVGQALITTHDVAELMDTLVKELPRLDIRSCYLSLYEDPRSPAEWSRLVLAYREGKRVVLEEGGRRFASRQLVPEGLLPQDRRYQSIVEPFYFRESQIGFVLFEFEKGVQQEGLISEALRGQLSSALQGATLVQQVERRALQLQTAAQVSRAASSFLSLDELLPQVVNLIHDRFHLYYAGLFLVEDPRPGVDEAGRYAVLRAGTGEAGQKMLEAGHKLEIGGASMIGWCVANGEARIALDVGAEAVRFSNPLLPQTRSEMALPLASRGRVIGAITVQSDRPAAFDQDDITVLQTLADQIANAIENARLFDALSWEQHLMEALMDNFPDYIYFKDIHSRFIRASKALARSFGLSDSAQLVGKTDFDFFTEEHARPAYEDEQRIVQTGQPLMNIEEKEKRPDRPGAWVLTTKMPLRDQAGKIIGTFGISTDITGLKLAETQAREALQELEHLYRLTSREGWQTLHETTQLVPGYLFDRATLQPRPDLWMPQIEQAIEQHTFVPPTSEQAVAVAPLSVRGEVIGAVGVYDDPQRPLSAEELDLVQQITEQGALALESARLFEQTQASLAEARALYHFSEVTSRETDLQAIYDAVSHMLVEEWGYASTWISVLDEDGRMLTGVAGAGADMTEETIRATLSVSEAHLPATLAVQERKAIAVNDPLSDERLADLPPTIRASLGKTIAMPVTAGDELKGIIAATRSQASADISGRDERLLQAVASQVAVAIQRAQLFEQTRAALDEVEATHRRYLREQWETYLAAALDRSTGFVDSSAGLMPAGDVWLPEMEQVLERGETIVASASNNQAQHAALAVPLKLRGAPIGVLEFYEEDQPHKWSDDERALVQALADQAVLALENARLFEETQARAQREQLINAITARIRASTEMETILRTTAEELSKALNLSRARIHLRTDDGGKAMD